MKITIVSGFFLPIPPIQGGATEKSWYRLATIFAAEGHEVTYISRRWPTFPDAEREGGIRHIRMPGFNHTRRLWLNLILDFLWSIRVTFVIPPGDILVSHCVSLPIWIGRLRPKSGKLVSVVARMPKGQTRLYGGVDRLFALTSAVATVIQRENPALAERITLVPCPIDWPLLAKASAQSSNGGTVRVGYVGRLNEEKGIELLLSAASLLSSRADLPSWKLVLRGPVAIPSGGSGEAWLAELTNRFDSSIGTRLEVLPPEFDAAKLAAHYGTIDVFAYPSLAEAGETFGIAVAEAMAAGCAPVVSSLACFTDLIPDVGTGLVFDHRSPRAAAELADCLAELIADPKRRENMGQTASAFVRQFDYSEVAKKSEQAFTSLLRPKSVGNK